MMNAINNPTMITRKDPRTTIASFDIYYTSEKFVIFLDKTHYNSCIEFVSVAK